MSLNHPISGLICAVWANCRARVCLIIDARSYFVLSLRRAASLPMLLQPYLRQASGAARKRDPSCDYRSQSQRTDWLGLASSSQTLARTSRACSSDFSRFARHETSSCPRYVTLLFQCSTEFVWSCQYWRLKTFHVTHRSWKATRDLSWSLFRLGSHSFLMTSKCLYWRAITND